MEGENREVLFNGWRASVLQDEKAVELEYLAV